MENREYIAGVLVALLLLSSCAPLRPLAPDQPKGYTRYEPTVTKQKAKKKYEQQNNQGSQQNNQDSQQNNQAITDKVITGIDAWDRVLSPWLGTPYLLGGTTKSGVDCSGFVSAVYREKEGMYIPRTSADEFKIGKSVSKNNLIIGDLVFFGERSKVSHVGIYIGKGSFIHASTSLGVTVTPLDDSYWKPRYIGARRYL